MTSLKKRLDNILNELGLLGSEPDEKASCNIVAELSVVKEAFKESANFPVCCFRYDAESKVVCDVEGPLDLDEFMAKCKQCQAGIKKLLSCLKTD